MKPANILPFLIIAFIGYQFIKMRPGNPEPQEPASPGWDIIEEEAPDFNPYVDVDSTDGQSEDIPQSGEPVAPPKRLTTQTPKTVALGNGFSEGYHHEEGAEPEQAGTRPPDLRKPSSNYPTYYGPNGATWNEIAPATNPTPEPEKPKRRFGLFKRKSR